MKKIVECSSTRFYITQKNYDELIKFPNSEFKLNITPIKGKHPKGIYIIPNKIALKFIQTKQVSYNWDKHQNFKQDSIPVALQKYFTYL